MYECVNVVYAENFMLNFLNIIHTVFLNRVYFVMEQVYQLCLLWYKKWPFVNLLFILTGLDSNVNVPQFISVFWRVCISEGFVYFLYIP